MIESRNIEQFDGAQDRTPIEDRIAALTTQLDRTRADLVRLVDQFDRSGRYLRDGQESTAKWLEWRCELAPSTARELVRVARALRELPQIAGALGELQFCRIRAITRIATGDDESHWLDLARRTPVRELERLVMVARADRARTDPAVQQEMRSLRSRLRSDGMTEVIAVLPPVDAAMFMKAIRIAGRSLVLEEDDANGSPLPDRRRADAAVLVARTFLEGGSAAPVSRSRALLLVHLDGVSREARLGSGPALAREAFDEMLCDSLVALVGRDPRGGVRLSSAKHVLSPRLRREILLRDRRCRFPGCANDQFLHVHHRTPGVRDPEKVLALCSFHHRFVHANDLTLEWTKKGGVIALFPDGRVVRASPNVA